MGYEDVGRVIDRWMNDPDFKKQLRQNPDECVRKCGIKLNTDEWAALKKVDWTLSDEDLKTRISKIPL